MNKLIKLSIIILILHACTDDKRPVIQDTPTIMTDTASTPPTDSMPIISLGKEQDSIRLRTKVLKDSLSTSEQPLDLSWKILSDISFENKMNDTLESYIEYPVFGAGPLAYDGSEIRIDGYMIPVAETGNEEIFILSAFPYSQCFFCGQAGLESILDIQLKNEPKRALKLDEQLSFRGKLRLNDTDLDYLIYILDEAELIE